MVASTLSPSAGAGATTSGAGAAAPVAGATTSPGSVVDNFTDLARTAVSGGLDVARRGLAAAAPILKRGVESGIDGGFSFAAAFGAGKLLPGAGGGADRPNKEGTSAASSNLDMSSQPPKGNSAAGEAPQPGNGSAGVGVAVAPANPPAKEKDDKDNDPGMAPA